MGIFSGVKDPRLKGLLEKFADFTRRREPATAYQIVDVLFSAANVDVDITHTLTPLHPEDVRYTVLRQSANAVVYQDLSSTRTAWQQNLIHLRASTPTAARVLLTLETEPLVGSVALTGPRQNRKTHLRPSRFHLPHDGRYAQRPHHGPPRRGQRRHPREHHLWQWVCGSDRPPGARRFCDV
jgi:hypothetical protein